MNETIRPVDISEYYIKQVQKGLEKYLWDNLFNPIFDIIKSKSVVNAKDDVLLSAIKSGKLYYQNGAFRSINDRFSSNVSAALENMGAKFKYNAYYIDRSLIPIQYLQTMGFVEAQAAIKATAISKFLLNYLNNNNVNVKQFIQVAAESMFKKLQLDLIKSIEAKEIPIIELGLTTPKVNIPKETRKNIETYWDEQDTQAAKLHDDWKRASDIFEHLKQKGIVKGEEYDKAEENKNKKAEILREFQLQKYLNAPKINIDINDIELDKKSKQIAEDYTYNMQYWVKGWETNNITKMRKEILDMYQKGIRLPELERYFMSRWNIARHKARFLAVNESHLAGSVIKATQYKMIGCTQFKWLPSVSVEKRKDHKELYGKIFDFDNPPIIDEKLGIKGLPRQIWNCRCGMEAIMPKINIETRIKNAKRNFIERIKYAIENSKQRNNNTWRYRRFGEG